MFKNYLNKLQNVKSVEEETAVNDENQEVNNNKNENSDKKKVVLARLRYKSIAADLVDFLIR